MFPASFRHGGLLPTCDHENFEPLRFKISNVRGSTSNPSKLRGLTTGTGPRLRHVHCRCAAGAELEAHGRRARGARAPAAAPQLRIGELESSEVRAIDGEKRSTSNCDHVSQNSQLVKGKRESGLSKTSKNTINFHNRRLLSAKSLYIERRVDPETEANKNVCEN